MTEQYLLQKVGCPNLNCQIQEPHGKIRIRRYTPKGYGKIEWECEFRGNLGESNAEKTARDLLEGWGCQCVNMQEAFETGCDFIYQSK